MPSRNGCDGNNMSSVVVNKAPAKCSAAVRGKACRHHSTASVTNTGNCRMKSPL